MDEEERPTPNQVELALMVARPGVRLGVKPAFVLAREVRALQTQLGWPENERLKQLKIARSSVDALERELRALREVNAQLRAALAARIDDECKLEGPS